MKSKKRYIVTAFLLAALIGAYALYQYMYKEHRDIATEKIDFVLNPTALSETMSDAQKAPEYTDKVIQTYGKVTSIEQNSVILDDQVQVNFTTHNINNIKPGNELHIKGRCIGYDDLLELVKIDQATRINN
ncbi:MAG: hypothetical protein QNJ57_05675 [Flavobacteriaceae bacterium]|nr:hypothetical protein [Flavobacteriaceae bacterium]